MQTIQEITETWVAAGTKKGLKLPTRTNESEEIFLSKVKLICEASGVKITESRKIDRKNGSGTFSENDTVSRDERVLKFMQDGRFNYREACFMVGETPERDVKQTASITESIVAAWKKYSPWLSEKDCRTLAEMGKLP